ncbi:cytochrome P450 [Diplogelasinospora grovesii]|uniref:Cytochrome P450 n=1 Tax=Diplogelasinospora grovesii TaxID=303347 RepID=A0AAN6N408_9PEZI|nr:cytochrome P450 [Diplogelasinospora grovesii]
MISASYAFLRALLRLTQDGREPPTVATTVPFISPLIGMLARGPAFFNGLSDRYGPPIYTLRLPGTRLYMVNSAALITAIEAATSIGLLSNTMPTAFWVVYHMFSDPTLLQECRRELSAAVQEQGVVCTLDLAVVRNSCPVLLSTFQEVFRFYGISVGVRVVQEDSMLEGKYLLKKGSTVIIPGSVQHNLRSVWGDAVDTFDYKRFIPEQGSKVDCRTR